MLQKLEERYPAIVGTTPGGVSPHRTTWDKARFTQPWVTSLEIGELRLNIFTFIEAGHLLPLHSHPDGECHITFVNAGRFRIFGEGWERIAETGDRFQFDVGQVHAYEALEPKSQLTNITY